jgi:primosomal protein N' (replication factor Y)
MSPSARILEISVPSPLYRRFDYSLPASMARPAPGSRVLVPFGRRQVVGIVLTEKDHSEVEAARLKPVARILDVGPVFDSELLQLLCWAADYYHHPIGEVLSTALPALLRRPGNRSDARVRVWRLTATGRQIAADDLTRAPRQQRVISALVARPEGLERDALDVPADVLNTLKEKGWIERAEPAPPDQDADPADIREPAPTLSDPQAAAVQAVSAAFDRFQPFLLEGVTGSGKTEVYLRVAEPLLQQGRQVLVLVPEIGLTPQLVSRFRRRFEVELAVLHSGLSDGQRLHAWRQSANGRARLILGTRSAVFTPLAAAGLIIVDEEHDSSLKQQEGFRYSARDLAVWRARQLEIPIVLGSATPSLESLYNVDRGRYRHLLLPERAGRALAPILRLLDLRGQPMRELLSAPLTAAMEAHLSEGGQVLLFLNRRGYAPVLLCHDCGWVAECRRCDARMTLHQRSRELRCHHCGSQRRVDSHCPACGSSELIGIGEGTQRIEQALLERFPAETVLRIDRDSTRRRGRLEQALADAEAGKARILLGTQMLAKGHHFPQVTLVAILDADQGLFSTDFRASERMAQLIIQVAGRAGRADRRGEVLIQTHHPDHPLLRQLVTEGYPAFARAALQERRDAGLPPYASIAVLRAEATAAGAPEEFLDRARVLAAPCTDADTQLWGPVAAPMQRRAGRYRAQLLVQASDRAPLQRLLRQWVEQLNGIKSARRVRWSIDVDPLDLL